MGAPNCNLHLNIAELHLQYFRVLPVKYNYMLWSLKHFICSHNSVAWTAFHVLSCSSAFQIVPISGEDFWESWEKSHFTEGPEESNLLKSLLQHKFVSTTSTRIWTHILPRKVKTLYCYYSQVSSGDHPTPSQPSRTTKAQCSPVSSQDHPSSWKTSATTKAQMFTIFFLGPDFIIANIRNNNVTHNEPVSSQEQPSSLQTTGTTKARFILLWVMLILHIPIKNNDLHDKEPPNQEKGWNIWSLQDWYTLLPYEQWKFIWCPIVVNCRYSLTHPWHFHP